MGIQSLGLLAGATVSATGGTAFTMTPDGVDVTSGVHVADAAVSDFRVRPNATFKTKQPVLQQDGKYTREKRSVSYNVPKILADGSVEFNTVRIERTIHPESTASEATHLLNIGAQLCIDADVAAFWSAGSLA